MSLISCLCRRPDSAFTVPRSRRRSNALVLSAAIFGAGGALVVPASAAPAAAPVDLGAAASFAVLAGSTVTNTASPTQVSGDLGVSPGTAVTGFPPGVVINGDIHPNATDTTTASDAHTAAAAAYSDAADPARASEFVGPELGGLTLTDGVYSGGALEITGTLTLDAQNLPGSVFIFRATSTLVTASASKVVFINGANPCNVFWQVTSSATLGTDSEFGGTILALASITATHGVVVQGRLLAITAAVTLDDNAVSSTSCVAAPATTTTAPTTVPTTTTTTVPVTTTTEPATTTTTEPGTTTTTIPATTTTTTVPVTTTTVAVTTTAIPATTTTVPVTTTTTPVTAVPAATTSMPATATTVPATTTTTMPTVTTTVPATTTTATTTTNPFPFTVAPRAPTPPSTVVAAAAPPLAPSPTTPAITAARPPATVVQATPTTIIEIDTQTTPRLPTTGSDAAVATAVALAAIAAGLHAVASGRRGRLPRAAARTWFSTRP